MKRVIKVTPIGGLGNRIRVIISALNLAYSTNSELVVIWMLDNGLNCKYENLFEPTTLFKVINRQETFFHRFIDKLNYKIPVKKVFYRLFHFTNYISNIEIYYYNRNGEMESLYNKMQEFDHKQNLNIESCYSFFNRIQYDYNSLVPNRLISKEINEFANNFSENTVGIHIRRTDNMNSIMYSTDDLFIDKMNQEIILNEKTTFFLSTDDLNIQNKLKDLFPNIILTYSSDKSRNSDVGIQQAFIDLLLLSRTKKIYGSYWSTFSMIASEIGGISLEILSVSETKLPPIY